MVLAMVVLLMHTRSTAEIEIEIAPLLLVVAVSCCLLWSRKEGRRRKTKNGLKWPRRLKGESDHTLTNTNEYGTQ